MIINIQFYNMPPGMHGAATKNEDGSFTIFLDPRDSYAQQMKGYAHELEHIRRGDLDNRCEKNIGLIERSAHTEGLDYGTISDVFEEVTR